MNKFLDLPDDIESDFLDVDVLENLDLIGKTLCDDVNFVWGKCTFIRQSELTKVSAFWHLFVCSNLVVPLMLPSSIEKRSRLFMIW